VLTSDAGGNASWTFSALKAISGTLPATTSSFTNYNNTGSGNSTLATNASIAYPGKMGMVAFGTTATIGVLSPPSTFSYVIETDGSL